METGDRSVGGSALGGGSGLAEIGCEVVAQSIVVRRRLDAVLQLLDGRLPIARIVQNQGMQKVRNGPLRIELLGGGDVRQSLLGPPQAVTGSSPGREALVLKVGIPEPHRLVQCLLRL